MNRLGDMWKGSLKRGSLITLNVPGVEKGGFSRIFDAFENWPDHVCYIPEFVDAKYTGEDFLRLARGQEEIARDMFYECSGETPEDWLACQIESGRVIRCGRCGTLYYKKRKKVCPYCGK